MKLPESKTMLRRFVLALAMSLALAVSTSYAQADRPAPPTEEQMEADMAKIESARVALITTRLSMTPEQARDFWPVYNEFNAKRKTMRRNMMELFRSAKAQPEDKPDEEALRNIVKRMVALRVEEANLDKDYSDKFMRILKPSQVAKLYSTEKEVMRTLLKQMGRGKHGQKPDGQPD